MRVYSLEEARNWFLTHSEGTVTCMDGTDERSCCTYSEAELFYNAPIVGGHPDLDRFNHDDGDVLHDGTVGVEASARHAVIDGERLDSSHPITEEESILLGSAILENAIEDAFTADPVPNDGDDRSFVDDRSSFEGGGGDTGGGGSGGDF